MEYLLGVEILDPLDDLANIYFDLFLCELFFNFELHLKVSLGAVLEEDVLVGFVFEPVIEVDDDFVGE